MPTQNIDAAWSFKLSVLHEDVGDMKAALKELAAAITKFAVFEERQATAAVAMERAFKSLEKVEARLMVQEGISNEVAHALQLHLANLKDTQARLERHLKDFEESKDRQEELINKGLGMWKIIPYVLSAVQAVLVWVALNIHSDLKEVHTSIESLRLSDVRIIERMNSASSKQP